MKFRFASAITGRPLRLNYISPAVDVESLFGLLPPSPIVRFMDRPIDVEFIPVPSSIPGRSITLESFGPFPQGVDFNGFYKTLTGTPIEGGIWRFTVEVNLT